MQSCIPRPQARWETHLQDQLNKMLLSTSHPFSHSDLEGSEKGILNWVYDSSLMYTQKKFLIPEKGLKYWNETVVTIKNDQKYMQFLWNIIKIG